MYYKDPQNKIHSIESSQYEYLLPIGSVAITDEEAEAIRLANIPVLSKADVWQRIKAERDRRIQDGGYKVGSKWYHSDTFSRTQQMGLVMMGASIPANTPWKTMDGSFVIMTQTLAGKIFDTAAASDVAIFSAAEAHRVAMEASANPAAYDFTGGWPPMFGA